MALSVAVTFAALLAGPIAAGAILGIVLRRLRGRRFGGVAAAVALLALPAVVLVQLDLRVPVIGLWDAWLEGLLFGAGLAWTAHAGFARPGGAPLAAASLLVSLVVLEIASAAFLPPPPGFPAEEGPHFLLADALRAATRSHSWDFRSKEIVCVAVYGDEYPGILEVRSEREVIVPANFTPRTAATRRVLHIGDSMTFGISLPRDAAFPAVLEHLEPDVQHINGAVPGIAPDAYLLLLEQWLATHDLDLGVMYIFEGNDLAGVDDAYPCCRWDSMLVYGSGGPARRCPTAVPIDFANAGSTWLRYNSPPPYLFRALAAHSTAAAHAAAAIVNTMPNKPLTARQSEETALQHLAAILAAARDAMHARGVPFVVVVLPARTWIENPATPHAAPALLGVARALGIPALDPGSVLAAAAQRGERVFLDAPADPHYGPAGHALIARWLHEELNGIVRP